MVHESYFAEGTGATCWRSIARAEYVRSSRKRCQAQRVDAHISSWLSQEYKRTSSAVTNRRQIPVGHSETEIDTLQASIQGIIFVVLRSGHRNRHVQALLRQLVHPDVIVHRDGALHRPTTVRRLRACRGLTAKLPARVNERVHGSFSLEHEDIPKLRYSKAKSGLQFDHFHICLLLRLVIHHNALPITRAPKENLEPHIAEHCVASRFFDCCL